jgi:deoxyribodipyrimidine photo-lyase
VANVLERGSSGVAIMDHFARELVDTGYLHNHTRMWFAAFWIRTRQLPWELGADFFMRHLIDADAASNTLSWRWVAGLHTSGKTYLARRSNIEKFCHPDILTKNSAGLEQLDSPTPADIPESPNPEPRPFPSTAPIDLDQGKFARIGLWLHDEDLLPEDSELENLRPGAILVTGDARHAEALEDCRARASAHYGVEAKRGDLSELSCWAMVERLNNIVALKPFTGPLFDQFDHTRPALPCEFHLIRRQQDAGIMRLATGGFFNFWKKVQRMDRDSRQRR